MSETTKEGWKYRCYFCEKKVTDDDWCFGCHHFICEDCSTLDDNPPMGPHEIEDHQADKKEAA
jgi:hypothetical protein